MIVVFGSINLDLVIRLQHLPAPGETVLGEGYQLLPGGKGANQALAAARDGAAVTLVGAVGRDAFAGLALAALEQAEVDLVSVARTATPTGCAAISVAANGENHIAVASGANAAVTASQVPDRLLGPATTLVLQMEVSGAETAALIVRARKLGTRIVLNLAPALPIDETALRAVDLLVVNEGEASTLADRLGADSLARHLGVTAIETLGATGARAYTPDGTTWRIGSLPITPVDTTAAGDAFAGVLAAALDRGLDLPTALRRASVAAGLACTAEGAQPSLPTGAAIDAALERLAPAAIV